MKIKNLSMNYETSEMVISFEDNTQMQFAYQAVTKQVETIAKELLDRELRNILRGGNLINAIKLHREKTGSYLKESKDYCEALRDAMPGQR